MKRLLVLAAGTLGTAGAALAVSGVITAAPASAQTCAEDTPPLTPTRVVCVINEQAGTFAMTVSPAYNLDLLINGNPDPDSPTGRDGLGLVDQPTTFVNSVADFFNGPRSPE